MQESTSFELRPVPPFRLDLTAWALRRRPDNVIDRWDGHSYKRVLLRALGRLHIFPGDDVGARHSLKRWLGLAGSLDYQAVRRNLERWHPYEGLVYLHLLLSRLSQLGYIT